MAKWGILVPLALGAAFVWFAIPSLQTSIEGFCAAALACYVASTMVEDIVRRTVQHELDKLREDNSAIRRQLADIKTYSEATWHETQQIRGYEAVRNGRPD